MFDIPSLYQKNISFEEAVSFLQDTHESGNLFKALERMNAICKYHQTLSTMRNVLLPLDDDQFWQRSMDEFFEAWTDEVNAYNVVMSATKKLYVKNNPA